MGLNSPSRVVGAIRIAVSNLQKELVIGTGWIEELLTRLLRSEGVHAAEISVIVVDDAAIRGINAHHLAHDWPTDVISFAFGLPDQMNLEGELVVSAETAIREASLRQIPPHDEFALYLVHGLLHLCGHDDQTEADAEVMRRREGEILADLGIANPFGRCADPKLNA